VIDPGPPFIKGPPVMIPAAFPLPQPLILVSVLIRFRESVGLA